jgi:UDP-N-acetylmuramoylalanine--D-glutamate ligase
VVEDATVRAWTDDGAIRFSVSGLRLPGEHHVENAAFAGVMAWLLGADGTAIASAVASFDGLPDRLEYVAEKRGAAYYNDSIATTPASAIAGLRAFDAPVLLIAGGSPKGHDFAELAACAVGRCKAVFLIGATSDAIERALRARMEADRPHLRRCGSLEEAVRGAAGLAAPGDVVLLSPACASYDMFRNYRDRSRAFRRAVRAL